jgi:hypothetical protein
MALAMFICLNLDDCLVVCFADENSMNDDGWLLEVWNAKGEVITQGVIDTSEGIVQQGTLLTPQLLNYLFHP